MLVRDEARQARDVATQALESYEDRVNRWTAETLGRGIILPTDHNTVINPVKQAGRTLTCRQFEKLISKLSFNLATEVHPHNPARGCIWFVKPSSREFVSAYDRAILPEYSIFKARWVWKPDPEYFAGATRRTVERPKGAGVTLQEADRLIREKGKNGALQYLREKRSDSDPDYRPGQRRVLELAGEAIRGWRTHLVYCVQHGACTLGDVERALVVSGLPAHADNAHWARFTGRQSVDAANY